EAIKGHLIISPYGFRIIFHLSYQKQADSLRSLLNWQQGTRLMTSNTEGMRYQDAGVNIDAAEEALGRVKSTIKKTFDQNVLEDIGSFGAMYNIGALGMKD